MKLVKVVLNMTCLYLATAMWLMLVWHSLQSDDGDTVFEYLVREDNAEWQHWRECVPSWKYPKEQERPKFAQLVIPTLDSVRYEKLLTLAYSVQKVRRGMALVTNKQRSLCIKKLY